MSKRLLALDQSSRTSGYAVFDGEKLIKSGTFTFSNQNVGKRLVQIKQRIQELIEEYEIEEIIFEDIYADGQKINNMKTFKVLAEVYGVILEYLTETGLPHSSINAPSWRSHLGIKGRTRTDQKKNAQEYIYNKYQINVSNDEADAICIGLSVIVNPNDWS